MGDSRLECHCQGNVEGVGWRGEIPIGEGEGEFQCSRKSGE